MTKRRRHQVRHTPFTQVVQVQGHRLRSREQIRIWQFGSLNKREQRRNDNAVKANGVYSEACKRFPRRKWSVPVGTIHKEIIQRTLPKKVKTLHVQMFKRCSIYNSNENFRVRAMEGHSRGAVQPNFFTQENLPIHFTEELHPIGYTKLQDAIKEGSLVPGRFKNFQTHSSLLWTRILIQDSKLTSI